MGMLDPFWESKGYVTPEAFRRFCGPTVPLLRMEKCVFTRSETFRGRAEVTHFGPAPLAGVTPRWCVKNAAGDTLLEGALARQDIPRGSAVALGEVQFAFAELPVPSQLTLELTVDAFTNDWHFWVYPDPLKSRPDGIHIAASLDDTALEVLHNGGKGVAVARHGHRRPAPFRQRTLGVSARLLEHLLVPDAAAAHAGPALRPGTAPVREISTAFHSDWQWWDLVSKAPGDVSGRLPQEVHPLVQVIDDWNTCRRLGLVFEAQVGSGRLLACSMDIETDLGQRYAARQFRTSLLAYMQPMPLPRHSNLRSSSEDGVSGTFGSVRTVFVGQ